MNKEASAPDPVTPPLVKQRLFYIDNIRLLIIACVVMHHLAVTYSGNGSWYYTELPQPGAVLSQLWFGLYLSFQQAYFMGAMFLFAGYFAVSAYDRKGFGKFLWDRFIRLIIPTLVYMVFLDPFMSYVELGNKFNLSQATWIGFLSSNGVMWFAAALFIFSAVYAVVRIIGRKIVQKIGRKNGRKDDVGHVADRKPGAKGLSFWILLALIGIIAVFAFIIRLFQPAGTNILNMQIGNFSSYIVLFIAGILAYRYDLLAAISYRTGKLWLICGITLAILLLLGIGIGIGIKLAGGDESMLKGGFNVYSFLYALYESLVAVAMCTGLIGVFREKLNRQNRFVKALSDSSFTVYMFHPVIIVGVTVLCRSVALQPVVKWIVMSVICVPLCFAIAHFILRKIPLLDKIL
ncbi:MAG: acyltransferase family protein [Treponema sp.]|nr:acyltransferase family protein [Treponema sp.]